MANPIIGTGDANTDVNSVQNAVNAGGVVQLKGNFNFGNQSVAITKGVTISGVNKWVTIQGGKFAFDVQGGQSVTIERIRFFQPQLFAVQVGAVNGLLISGCKIEQVQPVQTTQAGETFTTAAGIVVIPTAKGRLDFLDNEIDIGAGSPHRTLGMLFSGTSADLTIRGNKIANVTGYGLDFRDTTGTVTIEANDIAMGPIGVSKPGFSVSGIRCFAQTKDGGSHSIVGNRINCGSEKAAGIRLLGNIADAKIGGRVEDNEIIMSSPDSVLASALSADIENGRTKIMNVGIQIGGLLSSTVANNRISGSAMAAFSAVNRIARKLAGRSVQVEECITVETIFLENRQIGFTSLVADYVIGENVGFTGIRAPQEFLSTTMKLAGTVLDLSGTAEIVGDYAVV